MKAVCAKHHTAYEVSLGCHYCSAPAPKVPYTGNPPPLTLRSIYYTLRATRSTIVDTHVRVNEKTYRAFFDDPNSQAWLDIVVEIRDGIDFDHKGNPLPGKPVPPPDKVVAQFLGVWLHIDPSVEDNDFAVN